MIQGDLFPAGENISPADVKKYMAEHEPGTYQLLDVRQPREFAESHLPGAVLIPVKELQDRMSEVDRHIPTFVYWRSGMRSKAAAGLLNSAGFTNILNMSGGILRYDGGKAMGTEAFGMDQFLGQEFPDMFRLSYAMEEGMRQLYIALQECTDNPEIVAMLDRFARYEDGHKAKLLASFPGSKSEGPQDVSRLEGGFDKQQFLDHYREHLPEKRDMVELGMMLETQALDLYSRLSRETEDMQSRELFTFLASEEKMHLQVLSRELDTI